MPHFYISVFPTAENIPKNLGISTFGGLRAFPNDFPLLKDVLPATINFYVVQKRFRIHNRRFPAFPKPFHTLQKKNFQHKTKPQSPLHAVALFVPPARARARVNRDRQAAAAAAARAKRARGGERRSLRNPRCSRGSNSRDLYTRRRGVFCPPLGPILPRSGSTAHVRRPQVARNGHAR